MNGDCEYVVDGTDTDGTVWHRCTTHDELAPSPDAPCAGYIEIPYIEAEARQPDSEALWQHWRFFADHPLPWEIGTGSPGTWVEDANHEVLWRFDHFDAEQVQRFVSSLNEIVSVEEGPYIRGYNKGWDDAALPPSDPLVLDVERLRREIEDEIAKASDLTKADSFENGALAAYNWVLSRLSAQPEDFA